MQREIYAQPTYHSLCRSTQQERMIRFPCPGIVVSSVLMQGRLQSRDGE